jgi:RNA-directed DNA polymerase
MDHALLLGSLRQAGIGSDLRSIVADYLALPDKPDTGKAMVAGGALSPILGGLYLNPLDQIMGQDKRLVYVRYMDDFVVLAKTRWHLKKAIAKIHRITCDLKLRLHRKIKCFIRRTANGFDFLGYTIHPQRRLRPSSVSLQRLVSRARRLRAKEAIKIASGSTSPTGTDGYTEDLKGSSHAKEEYDVITSTS